MAKQLVLMDAEGKAILVERGLENVVVDGNNVSWSGGGADGIQKDFVILDDSIPIAEGDQVTTAHINQDQKAVCMSEIERLKEQLRYAQDAIDFLMGL